MQNLDSQINKISYEITNFLDTTLIEKCLGVLANDGVYAYYIYCKNKTDKQFIKYIYDKLKELLNSDFQSENTDVFFANLSQDLHQLLFVKEILEKILTYARYHSKAKGDKVNN